MTKAPMVALLLMGNSSNAAETDEMLLARVRTHTAIVLRAAIAAQEVDIERLCIATIRSGKRLVLIPALTAGAAEAWHEKRGGIAYYSGHLPLERTPESVRAIFDADPAAQKAPATTATAAK